ncbi:MAG TPA: hypothetical protein VIS55_09115, partial [Pseudomonadales bacterium]
PFVSKVTGTNFAEEAMRRMLGVRRATKVDALDLDHVGVKVPMFSFSRLAGADPVLGVEMASTGEVGCIGEDIHEALLKGLIATGFLLPKRGVLLSLGPWEDKFWFADEARALSEQLGLHLYATEGTADMLRSIGLRVRPVGKDESDRQSIRCLMESGAVDLVINVPRAYDQMGRPDGYLIRRMAIDSSTPLLTDQKLARAVIEAMLQKSPDDLHVTALGETIPSRWSNGSA